MHNAYLNVLGQILTHGATEIVGRGDTGALATERRNGSVPLAHLALGIAEVNGSHHLESLGHILIVLSLRPCIALHIRLTEAEIDMEVGVGLVGHGDILRHGFVLCIHS